MCRCGSQDQVPEEGSGRFRRVPACAGVGSGGGFRRFRKVPAYAGVGSGGSSEGSGEASSGRFRKISEGSGVCWRRFRKVGSGRSWKVPEGSGEFQCALV